MKNKLIIFDFLRTIYNPDEENFIADALSVLKELRRENKVVLYTSREGDKNRKDKLEELQLNSLFDEVFLVENKNKETLQELGIGYEKENIFVVGDRIKGEIKLGNQNGFTTVWFRQGKYKNELPNNNDEKPDYRIESLTDLLQLKN